MRCSALAIGVLAIGVVLGCGNDSGTGGADAGAGRADAASTGGSSGAAGAPTISTGLPPNKRLDELTPAERTQACNKIVGSVNGGSLNADYCKITSTVTAALASGLDPGATSGASDAEVREFCTQAYQTCVMDPQASPAACETIAMRSTTCTATVAELEACGGANAKALRDAAAGLPSCDKLTQATAGAALLTLGASPLTMQAAACNEFNRKCPGVIGTAP